MTHITKRHSIFLLILSLVFCGAIFLTPGQARAAGTPAPKLRFTKLTKGESRVISPEELGDQLEWGMRYIGFSEVEVDISGQSVPLEKALQDGRLSFDDIVYFARKDAPNGLCQESFASRLGLTHYTYQYPDCWLRIVDDVFETPAMGQRRVQDLAVYASNADVTGPYTGFLDQETGKRLDQPDYGVSCTVTEASPTGIQMTIDQSGGQQLGELKIILLQLEKEDGSALKEGKSMKLELPIFPNGPTTVTLDWTATYGTLPAGNYKMVLTLEDTYDEASLHPLMPRYFNAENVMADFTVS